MFSPPPSISVCRPDGADPRVSTTFQHTHKPPKILFEKIGIWEGKEERRKLQSITATKREKKVKKTAHEVTRDFRKRKTVKITKLSRQ
jgi:hypothetical protein